MAVYVCLLRAIGPETHAKRSMAALREGWVAPHERQYLAELLQRCGGKVDRAAKRAGINRVTFYRLMRKHGLKLRRAVEP